MDVTRGRFSCHKLNIKNSGRSCRKARAVFAVKKTNVPGDRRDYGTAKRCTIDEEI